MKSTVIVLLMCLTSVERTVHGSRTTQKNSRRQTTLDIPHIEALLPKGLRVSLPHREGMRLFAFHAKINSPILQNESGNIAHDVTHPVDGYWIFEDLSIEMRIGDIINYWIFVEINGMGYRRDNLAKIITERVLPSKWQGTHANQEVHYSSTISPSSALSSSENRYQSTEPTVSPCHVDCNCDLSELKVITSQLNVTLMQVNNLNIKLAPLQVQVESLTELLQELIKDQNTGTQLLLVGDKPPGRNSLEAIRQLITEKLELLDLEHNILQAYNTDDGIYFEMSSPIDKKRILFRAQQRLQQSNYQIVDPQVGGGASNFVRTRLRAHYITDDMLRMSVGVSNGNRQKPEDYETDSLPENSYFDRSTNRSTVRQGQQNTNRRAQGNLVSQRQNNSNNRETQYSDDGSDRRSSSAEYRNRPDTWIG